MISSISVSEPASTFLILCMYIFYNVNYIDRVWEVFVKCIKLKLHLASTCSLSIKLMALGPAGCGPRVQARVDQAGGSKDAPAQTLHP